MFHNEIKYGTQDIRAVKTMPKLVSGFTMIELLVTIGIFTVMTGVVLASYRTYDTNANFANASEDVVLALRQAQVYGVGQKGQSGSFSTPYGAFFSNGTLAKSHQVIIFADTTPDNIYTAADTILQTITWPNNIGVKTGNGGLWCDSSTGVNNLSFVFTRPFPDAKITKGTAAPGTSCLTSGKVVITDTNTGKTSTIYVSTTGQISLQ